MRPHDDDDRASSRQADSNGVRVRLGNDNAKRADTEYEVRRMEAVSSLPFDRFREAKPERKESTI
jgi:hypothetical protein